MANANKGNITKRSDLNRSLTIPEGDQNFTELFNVIEDSNNLKLEVSERTIYIESIAEGINGLSGVDNTNYFVNEWGQNTNTGGGPLVFDASVLKSAHDGIKFFSPTVPSVSTQTGVTLESREDNYRAGNGETDAAGSGVFVRARGPYSPLDAGARYDGAFDDSLAEADYTAASYRKGADLIQYSSLTVGEELDRIAPITGTATVTVPGDYPDLQSAIDEVSKWRISNNSAIKVLIQSGFTLSTGLYVREAMLGHVRIESEDSVVSLATGFTGYNSAAADVGDAVLFGEKCVMPRLSCRIDCAGIGGTGYALESSRGIVDGGCGVTNAGKYGLYLKQGSHCVATGAVFYDHNWGSRVTTGSHLVAPQSNFNSSKVQTYNGSTTANLDVSRGSVVYVTGTSTAKTQMRRSAGHGLAVRRSFVSADQVDVDLAALDGLNCDQASSVAFYGSVASEAGQNGIYAGSGCSVDARDATVGNPFNYGLFANNGGRIDARGITISSAGNQSVRAAQGSNININNGSVRIGVSDSTNDIVVTEGSIIRAVGAVGGTSITPQTLSVNGIIFK